MKAPVVFHLLLMTLLFVLVGCSNEEARLEALRAELDQLSQEIKQIETEHVEVESSLRAERELTEGVELLRQAEKRRDEALAKLRTVGVGEGSIKMEFSQ